MGEQEFFTFREFMRSDQVQLSPSAEDYLEMIYRLSKDQGFTRVSDLASSLNVQPPSVTKMIKKLSELHLIKYEKYGMIIMEPDGRVKGHQLLLRHNLIEDFLKFLRVNEDLLLEETEKIEHTMNKEILCEIQNLLDFFNENPSLLSQFHDYRNSKNAVSNLTGDD